MQIPKSAWSRALLIIPAVLIAYFSFVLLGGGSMSDAVNFLGTGTAQEAVAGSAAVTDQSALFEAVRKRNEELDKREKEIDRKAQELAVLDRDLLRTRNELIDERKKLEADKKDFEDLQAQRTSERIKHIAQTLKNTKAAIAAQQLRALYATNRVTALSVLSELDSRSAGKIFSQMPDADEAARILEDFKSWSAVRQKSGADGATQ